MTMNYVIFYTGFTYFTVILISKHFSIQLYSAFHDTNHCKAALQKIFSFYIIFKSRLLVVTIAEMYSKNHAVSYKWHVIKQTLLTAMIICCD